MVLRVRLSFLITCSDESEPYMILKALDQSYKNHIGFAIIRAMVRNSSRRRLPYPMGPRSFKGLLHT